MVCEEMVFWTNQSMWKYFLYGQAYRSFEIVARPSPNHFFPPILGGLGDVLKKKGTKKEASSFPSIFVSHWE